MSVSASGKVFFQNVINVCVVSRHSEKRTKQDIDLRRKMKILKEVEEAGRTKSKSKTDISKSFSISNRFFQVCITFSIIIFEKEKFWVLFMREFLL